jgi:hypothetical protein
MFLGNNEGDIGVIRWEENNSDDSGDIDLWKRKEDYNLQKIWILLLFFKISFFYML